MNPGREELVANVREGDVLAGKYRVERVRGVGGMGIVVAARHTQLDAAVAIKLLLPEMLASPSAVARFAREARAASKMTSEHVTRIFDVGELETPPRPPCSHVFERVAPWAVRRRATLRP